MGSKKIGGGSERIGKTDGEFSVCQFFVDGTHEYVRRWVSVEEAMDAFAHYTNNMATFVGVVERVIVTDGDDYTNVEWKKGEGITYPPEFKGWQGLKRKDAGKG